MKIIFLGTPDFAVPTLQALVNSHHKVVAVVTQPEKPSGRGKKLKPSPVKKLAQKYELPVFDFKNISKMGEELLQQFDADAMVTCAYGQILRKNILQLTPHGVINVHGSLLPKYRGSSPVQWTILNGEQFGGITILKSDVGIDDGPVLEMQKTQILPNETASELFDRLAQLAPSVLLPALQKIEDGTAVFVPQDHTHATVCQKLTKEMKQVNFDLPAQEVANHINGLDAGPVAQVDYEGMPLKLYKASVLSLQMQQNLGLQNTQTIPGQVVVAKVKQGIVVACKNGFVKLLKLQAPGAKVMDANSYLNGKTITVGAVLK